MAHCESKGDCLSARRAARHRLCDAVDMDPDAVAIIIGIIIFVVGLAYIARQTP